MALINVVNLKAYLYCYGKLLKSLQSILIGAIKSFNTKSLITAASWSSGQSF
jgi:hypothetical protein